MNTAIACPVCQAHVPVGEFSVDAGETDLQLQVCGKCGVVYLAEEPPHSAGARAAREPGAGKVDSER